MSQPKFITSRSGLDTDAPLYVGHVQHERSLNRAQSLAFLREKLGYPSAQISSEKILYRKTPCLTITGNETHGSFPVLPYMGRQIQSGSVGN